MRYTSKHRLWGTVGRLVRDSPLNPYEIKRKKEFQMYIIVFILGAMFGGSVGVFTMCLMQINRLNNENSLKVRERPKKHNEDNVL